MGNIRFGFVGLLIGQLVTETQSMVLQTNFTKFTKSGKVSPVTEQPFQGYQDYNGGATVMSQSDLWGNGVPISVPSTTATMHSATKVHHANRPYQSNLSPGKFEKLTPGSFQPKQACQIQADHPRKPSMRLKPQGADMQEPIDGDLGSSDDETIVLNPSVNPLSHKVQFRGDFTRNQAFLTFLESIDEPPTRSEPLTSIQTALHVFFQYQVSRPSKANDFSKVEKQVVQNLFKTLQTGMSQDIFETGDWRFNTRSFYEPNGAPFTHWFGDASSKIPHTLDMWSAGRKDGVMFVTCKPAKENVESAKAFTVLWEERPQEGGPRCNMALANGSGTLMEPLKHALDTLYPGGSFPCDKLHEYMAVVSGYGYFPQKADRCEVLGKFYDKIG